MINRQVNVEFPTIRILTATERYSIASHLDQVEERKSLIQMVRHLGTRSGGVQLQRIGAILPCCALRTMTDLASLIVALSSLPFYPSDTTPSFT
jgi:hypothetical protein